MFSSQLHTESMADRQRAIATGVVQAQYVRELRAPSERPRRGGSRRRFAAAIAVAIGVASGTAAIVPVSGNPPEAVARGLTTQTSARVLRVDARFRLLQRRVRELEARGFVAIACTLDGELMFNPHTHRSQTVRG